ncbi:uncharacterized protein LOC135496042 [Lineus longissimus]|uniref:uncharacterized protein LOC135496042 n=1 Tax=Lineus longissimus TaxID=88925 RepID=UPI00315C9F12
MAIHWFDLEKFYHEVDHILRPDGCLAIYSYNSGDIVYQGRKPDAASKVFTDANVADGLLLTRETPHHIRWSQGPKLPYEDSKRVDDQYLEISTNIRGVVGDLQSDSSYRAYAEAHPEDTQFLARYHDKLLETLGYPEEGPETPVVMRHPVAVLLSRKPRK